MYSGNVCAVAFCVPVASARTERAVPCVWFSNRWMSPEQRVEYMERNVFPFVSLAGVNQCLARRFAPERMCVQVRQAPMKDHSRAWCSGVHNSVVVEQKLVLHTHVIASVFRLAN